MAQPDELLAQWFREADPERAHLLLEALVADHANPVVRRIVRARLRSPADAEDVAQRTLLGLLLRLDRLKQENRPEAVRKFDAYVGSMSRNACHEYFRARYPERHRLILRLRYLVRHSRALALWQSDDGRDVCGLARDRDRTAIDDLSAVMAARDTLDAQHASLEELTTAIVNAAGGPLVFDDLAALVSEWSNPVEPRLQSIDDDEDEENAPPQLADRRPTVEAQLTELAYLRQLWSEIGLLPLLQRKALLLNLNESLGGDLALFDHLGIAGIQEIAHALEMPPLQFAELWNQLPLDDARLARELGISAQAVANRRSSARQRLARRMREVPQEKSGKNEGTPRSALFHRQDPQTR